MSLCRERVLSVPSQKIAGKRGIDKESLKDEKRNGMKEECRAIFELKFKSAFQDGKPVLYGQTIETQRKITKARMETLKVLQWPPKMSLSDDQSCSTPQHAIEEREEWAELFSQVITFDVSSSSSF